MKRFKTIDILRGLSIVWMICGHLTEWYIRPDSVWFFDITRSIGDFLGSGAFLFIAGISTALSLRNRVNKTDKIESYTTDMVKEEYFLRAFFLFAIAMIYNILVATVEKNPLNIWTWFILLTVSFSLFLGWPLLKLSKQKRILISGLFWIIDYSLLNFLSQYQGQFNLYGVLYHVLYNNIQLDPFLQFFTFFLIGTVIGDLILEVELIADLNLKSRVYKNKFLKPMLISGVLLILFGVLFQFPQFLHHRTTAWLIYSLGMELLLFSVIFSIEFFQLIKVKRSYKFLFYFSYYSFTIFLSHNLLYFLFLHQLYPFYVWIYISAIITIMGLVLRFIYRKFGPIFSIKVQIARLSTGLTKLKRKKYNNKFFKNIFRFNSQYAKS
jgi:uncharacterized membrane protein